MPPYLYSPRQRPPWWPENEPWPPPWPRRHYLFGRRFGCFFFIFNLLGIGLFWIGLAWIARRIGLADFPSPFFGAFGLPFVFLSILFIVGLAAGSVFALRRMSRPLDDLLAGAERVSQGDYTTPVKEKGPPEMRTLIRAFNGMLTRLHASDTRRRDLLADVSHELRTPLTVLRGNLEGMLDGVYTPDEAHLRALLEETQVLERLVEDLRTLALAESGALLLRREPTDLALLLHETAAAFQSSAGTVHIETACSADLPPVSADPARLREVIANLLTNAIKHSPAGGAIRLRCLPGEAGRAVVEVQDEGPGISAQDLPFIFDRFYKTSDSTGMGLGLSIARYLVEAHGGTIEASNPPGGGALLRLELPYTPAE